MSYPYNIVGDLWGDLLLPVFESRYMRNLLPYLKNLYETDTIYPEKQNIFRAFKECDPGELHTIILGQDPYNDGSANGLCFGNNKNATYLNSSLRKIIEAVETDIYCYELASFYQEFDVSLKSWADQGILLLNTSLTVKNNSPGSHAKIWRPFTSDLISILNKSYDSLIFCLWGREAQRFKYLINNKKHVVLEAAHPAHAARENRVWKCNHFSTINRKLESMNKKTVIW